MHLHFPEHPSGVESSQTDRHNSDHDAVQSDEVCLGLHDRITPPLGHLADTEDATREDGDIGKGKAGNEELEALVVEEFDSGRLEACAVCAGSDDIVRNQDAEDDEGKDLPDDTGHHEVVAGLL